MTTPSLASEDYVKGLETIVATLTAQCVRYEDEIEGYKRRIAHLVNEINALEKIRDLAYSTVR